MTDNQCTHILKEVKTKEDLDNVIHIYGLNYQDNRGESFLHYFSKNAKTDMMYHLIKKGNYDINVKDSNGRTALFEALNEEVVEFLLVCKIDYEARDNEGKKAEEVNPYVNFILNQKCNEIKKKAMKTMFR